MNQIQKNFAFGFSTENSVGNVYVIPMTSTSVRYLPLTKLADAF